MTILIGKYEFDGPYRNIDELKESEGLYAVLHYDGETYSLIHVAQADNITDCIELSPNSMATESVLVAAHYTSNCGARERRLMIEEIQKVLDGPDKIKEIAQLKQY